jgi:hypothetical protein
MVVLADGFEQCEMPEAARLGPRENQGVEGLDTAEVNKLIIYKLVY